MFAMICIQVREWEGEGDNWAEEKELSVPLRVGQSWQLGEEEEEEILEIIGLAEEVHVRKWKRRSPHSTYLSVREGDEAAYTMGCVTACTVERSCWQRDPPPLLTILGRETYPEQGRIACTVLAQYPRIVDNTLGAYTADWPLRQVKGHVYTDGSWTDDATLADKVAGRSLSRAAAAVYYNKGTNELAVRIVDTQGRMESAYSAELLAGVYAHLTSAHCTIHSDCTAAIRIIRRWINGWKVPVRDMGILGLIDRAEMYRTNSHVHQKAHPEKRHKTRLNWTDGDKGIYVADRVAGDDDTRGTGWAGVTPDLSRIDYSDILVLDQHNSGTILLTKDGVPMYGRPRGELDSRRHRKYVCDRDIGWGTGRAKWMRMSSQWAGTLAKSCKSRAGHAAMVRLIWDKTWHGRNKAKEGGTNAECLLCGHKLEDQAHILISCEELAGARKEALEAIDEIIEQLVGKPGQNWLAAILAIARRNCCTVAGAGWWTGMLQPEQWQELLEIQPPKTKQQVAKTLQKALVKLGKGFQAGALHIHMSRTRQLLEAQGGQGEQQQEAQGGQQRAHTPTIESYFGGARMVTSFGSSQKRKRVQAGGQVRVRHLEKQIGRLRLAGELEVLEESPRRRQTSMLEHVVREMKMDDADSDTEGDAGRWSRRTRRQGLKKKKRQPGREGERAQVVAEIGGKPRKEVKAARPLHRRETTTDDVRQKLLQLRAVVEARMGEHNKTEQRKERHSDQRGLTQQGQDGEDVGRRESEDIPAGYASWDDTEPPDPH
jgi:hypothetical protein